MAKRLELAEGDIIGPLQRFSYIKDLPAVKRKNGTSRKVEVQDIYTKEIFVALLSDIMSGHTKYPPSLSRHMAAEHRRTWNKNEIKNIEGNNIILLDDSLNIPKTSDGSRRYLFKNIDTGIEFIDTVSHVKKGYNVGVKRSKGEQVLRNILTELSINFISEHIFKDCVNPNTGNYLKFDFYLPDYNCCIEYDGEQHFKGWRKGRDAKSSLEQVQFRDNIKNNYCKEHGILLIRIPYTDYNKLDSCYVKEIFRRLNGSNYYVRNTAPN